MATNQQKALHEMEKAQVKLKIQKAATTLSNVKSFMKQTEKTYKDKFEMAEKKKELMK